MWLIPVAMAEKVELQVTGVAPASAVHLLLRSEEGLKIQDCNDAGQQVDQAADEIERLRADLSRAGQIAAGGEKRTVRESVSEIDQMRHVSETCRDTEPMPRGNRAEVSYALTDAEREAIRFAASLYERGERPADAATLRGLLKRLT